MNLQEQFDTAVAGLLKQNRRSMVVEANGCPHCLYRGPEDTKCGVGFLIPDEFYLPEMDEGWAAHHVVGYLNCETPITLDEDLCGWIQTIHDDKPAPDWPMEFTKLAVKLNLNTRVIDEHLSTRQ